MTAAQIIAIFNIIAPHALALIAATQQANPEKSYREVLTEAGVKLDAEAIRLLADMARAVDEGAIPVDNSVED